MALNWQTESRRYQRLRLGLGSFYRRKKVKVYTELVLTIVTIGVFLVFAIKPTLMTIAGLIKTIKDQRLVAEKLDEKITALNLAQNQYNLIQSDLYLVDEALPQQAQLTTLIKQVEVLGRNSGVTIEGIQLSEINLSEDGILTNKQTPINLTLVASGDYQNLKTFLKNLASLRRIIIINNFGFKTGKTETPSLSLSINNQTFYGIQKKD